MIFAASNLKIQGGAADKKTTKNHIHEGASRVFS